jgi:hypothetical protein
MVYLPDGGACCSVSYDGGWLQPADGMACSVP